MHTVCEKTEIQIDFLPEVTQADRIRVEAMTRSSDFFSSDEVDIALEVFDEYAKKGRASGYSWVFARNDGELVGYACFGPIPCTLSSYDLYWIVVDNNLRGHGIGKKLLAFSERQALQEGATRMYLDTSSRAQYDPTREFYHAAEYQVASVMDDYYAPGDAKVVFLKILNEPCP